MSEKIEPALSAEEWRAIIAEIDSDAANARPLAVILESLPSDGAIAILNHILPDSDPRKITRERIDVMRRAAWNVPEGYSGNAALSDFADALESYLPPETP